MSEFFSLCIGHLPNGYSVRPSDCYFIPDLRQHLSRAHPTEMILFLLRSIRSERLILQVGSRGEDPSLDTLEIIIKWLQVSFSERNRPTPQTKNPICV